MLRHARHLPAIVFAMKFVGQQVELRLQVFKDLWTLDRAWLAHLHLPFLDLRIKTHRLKRLAALLQPLYGMVNVTLVREEKIMVERPGIGERLVQLFVRLRTLWTGPQQRSNAFKHDRFLIIQRPGLALIVRSRVALRPRA